MTKNLLLCCGLLLFSAGCAEEIKGPASGSGAPAAAQGGGEHNAEHGMEHAAAGGATEFAVTSENTKVLFKGTKKSGDSQEGGFKTVTGTIEVDGDAVKSISVVIDADSLFSGSEKLTGHLKNEDFFSVKEFPELKFVSSKVEGSGEVTITGDLTMHGQTAEISFPATTAVADGNVTLNGKFKVDRTKFGMTYTGQPDNPINADVDIEISVGAE